MSDAPEWPAERLLMDPDRWAERKRPGPEGGSPPPGGSLSELPAGKLLAGRPADKPDSWVGSFPAEAVMEERQGEHCQREKKKMHIQTGQMKSKY